MAYRINKEVRNGREYAVSATKIDDRASMLRQSQRKLNSFSRTLNEGTLDELLKTLNSLSDMLKGKGKPDDETVENECDCDPKQPGCDCHNEDDGEEEVRTPEANAIVNGFRQHTGDTALQRRLRLNSGRQDAEDFNSEDRAAERRRALADSYRREEQSRKRNSNRPIQSEEDAIVSGFKANHGDDAVVRELRKRGR